MEITPYFGDKLVTASGMEVRINPQDRERANAIVAASTAITHVTDEPTFSAARTAAAQLKGILDEIDESKKAAKKPFEAVEKSINGLATSLSKPVKTEQERILGMLNVYVEKLKKAREAEEKRKAEEVRRKQAEADRKVREAQEEARKAQEALRQAQDEIQRALLQSEAKQRENVLLRQQLEQELAGDASELQHMLEGPPKGLVPGGRVDTVYDFELVNVQATTDARCFRLLRWELDIPACRDAVKNMVEMLPPDQEPTLPGIKITKRISVSVKAAS